MNEHDDNELRLAPDEAEARRRAAAVAGALRRLEDGGGRVDGGFLRALKAWKRIDRGELVPAVDHALAEVHRPTIEQVPQLWAQRTPRRPKRKTLRQRMADAAREQARKTRLLLAGAPESDPVALSRFCREMKARLS